MPQIFKFGGYIIFFWSNENKPTEPIHVHIAKHNPRALGIDGMVAFNSGLNF